MFASSAKDRLHQFHRAYLTSRGVEINAKGRWKCFIHEDSVASCNFVPGTEERLWHCHGCGETCDIFESCHYLDGRPKSGVEWYKETFCYLAGEFGVEVPNRNQELTEEEQHQLLVDQAFEKAARLVLCMKQSDMVRSKLTDYGWSAPIVRSFGIGGVSGFFEYLEEMNKAGFSEKFLKEIGLCDSRIFREQSLIYTIKDPVGRPIAFAGRNLLFEKEEAELEGLDKNSPEYKTKSFQHAPKYVNTSFAKRKVLFGFHLAKGNSSIYVFEGNADCVTAHNFGLLNSVAVCNARFNEEHLQLSLDNGVRHFICCFDSDRGGEGGKQKFAEFFDQQLASRPDVRAELIDLPSLDGEKVDPDVYIRRHGLKSFRELPRRSYFYWNAVQATLSTDRVSVAAAYVRKIMLQPDPLLRYDMLCQLSEATTIPPEFLWESVLQQARQLEGDAAQQILEAGKRMLLIREQPAQVKAVLVEPRKVSVRKAAPMVKLVSACQSSKTEQLHQAEQTTTRGADQWK